MYQATRWLLREVGKTDPKRLETHLLPHGRRILRTALRYAIERFPADKHSAILRMTRA